MNTKMKSLLAAGSLLALSAVTSHAQLQLNTITSTFSGQVGTNATTNGGANASSTIAFNPDTTSTFTLQTVPALASGTNFPTFPNSWSFDLWNIDYSAVAGPVTAQTLSSTNFNFAVDFAGGISNELNLNFTVNFAYIPVGGNNFLPKVTYSTVALSPLSGTFTNGTSTYQYLVTANGLDGGLFSGSAASSGTAHIDIALNLVAVPEPSTYALFGVVGLMGVVAVRRFRNKKSVAA